MSVKKLFIFLFVEICCFLFLNAEILNSNTWGFSVDLPEGFVLQNKNQNESFLFEHSQFPSTVVIRCYKKNQFSNSFAAIDKVMNQLSASYESTEVDWRYNDCVLVQFNFVFNGEDNLGWGVVSNLSEEKGYVVLLCYAPTTNYDDTCEQLVFSVLDSLCIEDGDFFASGPITAFAFPKTKRISYSTVIEGKKINFTMDKDAINSDSFVVEREYAILSLYKQSELWKEAWQRYYRQIFKNACDLVRESAFQIYTELSKVAKSDEELCQLLLTWVQSFTYERERTASDFTPITAAMTGVGSDCDSRALLLATLLYHFNFQTCIFVSLEYSHAVLGVVINKNGAKINVDGIDYLLGETTAQVELGLISAKMNNTDLWIPMELY